MSDKRICDHCNLPVVICNARYSIGVATDQGYDLADILPETGTPKREKSDHAELIERLRGVMAGCRIGDETEAALDAAVAEIAAAVAPIHRENAYLRAEVERLRGLIWYAWSEFNAIRARSGAPLTHDQMRTVSEEWWSEMTDAFADAIGDDAQTPWPSPAARAALGHTQGGR